MPGEDRQATLDYLNNGIRFDPGEMPDDSSYEADLDCNNQCGGPAKLTLRVYPERNSHKVNWEEAINGSTNRGYILAKMVNSSDKDFGPLGLKAGGSIYQWIGPTEANAKRRRVAWVTIDPATGEAEPFRMKKARIRLCAVDGWEKRTKPALKSWNSVTHGRCRFVRANLDEDETESDPILEPQYPPDMWDGCPGGCCQGQN